MKNLLVIERNPLELERAKSFFRSIRGVNFLTSDILNKKKLYGLGDIRLEPHIHDVPLHGIITDIYFHPKILSAIALLLPQIEQPHFAENLLQQDAGKTLFSEMGLRYMINANVLNATPACCFVSGFSSQLELDWVYSFSQVLGSFLEAPETVGTFGEKNWREAYEFFNGYWGVEEAIIRSQNLN